MRAQGLLNSEFRLARASLTTKRACLDPQGNALERAYVRAVRPLAAIASQMASSGCSTPAARSWRGSV